MPTTSAVQDAASWTVERMLGFMQDLNSRAARERSNMQANRAHFTRLSKLAGEITDPAAQAKVKAGLTNWIHRQVGIENAFAAGAAKFAEAKAALKKFLTSIGVTPPTTLDGIGLVPVVPAVLIGLALLAAAAITAAALSNSTQAKGLSAVEDVLGLVKAGQVGGDEAAKMMEQIRRTADQSANRADPFGVTSILQSALPVGLVLLALLVIPRMLPQRRAA